jgi:hypothetical protein
MACKYCGIASNEVLKLDAYDNEFHQSCEDEFDYSYGEWEAQCHAYDEYNWDGRDVNLGEGSL